MRQYSMDVFCNLKAGNVDRRFSFYYLPIYIVCLCMYMCMCACVCAFVGACLCMCNRACPEAGI